MFGTVSEVVARVGKVGTRVIVAAIDEVAPVLSRRRIVNIAGFILPSQSLTRTRTAILRAAGVTIGKHSQIQGPLRITGLGSLGDLKLGHHTLVTGDLHVDLAAPITIGSGVRLGHHVTLLTINHEIGGAELRAGRSFYQPIVIEDGAWLASRVTVLPGVTIGAGAIVAAGAVVTRDVAKNTMVGGVPARLIRHLDETDGR